MENIFIIGYYDHKNLGDDQYKNSFEYFIKNVLKYTNYKITFIDCDKLPEYKNIIKDDDIIIVGGGDVLNNYFLDTIILFFNNKKNILHAISVGIPYLNIVISNKLSIFNTIFIRTLQDVDLLKRIYTKIHIEYIPDISYYLIKDFESWIPPKNEFSDIGCLQQIQKKKIAISLSRNIFNKKYINEYHTIIKHFSIFVKYLLSENYHIIFVPFNLNSNENDTLIHDDIYNTMINMNLPNKEFIQNNTTNIKNYLNHNEVIDLFSKCDFIIPMKFHACLFSIYAKKPFFPIYTTRKIQNLLKDISWNYSYKLNTNEHDIPININLNVLTFRFKNLENNQHIAFEYINDIHNIFEKNSNNYKSLHISNKCRDIILINNNTTIDKINFIKDKIYQYLQSNNQKIIKSDTTKSKYTDLDLTQINDDQVQDIIVQIVSFYITGNNTQSIYNYGLKEKMFKENYNIDQEWSWIIEDYKMNNVVILQDNPEGIFNINYIDQKDYSNVHRSGWNYVYQNINKYHNSKTNLLIDLYIDKTFHWNYNINKILGIIPYTKSWCGFIHHTFDTSFSNYNCHYLLKNTLFIDSLRFCKGLFVLSNYLKTQLENELNKLNINVPIYNLVHPTELNIIKFDFNKFIKNKDKNILHIGGWLRNIYNFHKLKIPSNIKINNSFSFFNLKFIRIKTQTYPLQKVGLKGKYMNNYYPTNDLLPNLYNILINKHNTQIPYKSNEVPNCSTNEQLPNCSTNEQDHNPIINSSQITNNWNKHFYTDIENNINSVKIIEYIDNISYDNLLSCNIVFLNLVDASAINTLIECIARNTPIIINKIPPVIELLGNDYPMYYDNISEVYDLINQKTIYNAHKYIKKLDKSKLNISYFIFEFMQNIQNIQSISKLQNIKVL